MRAQYKHKPISRTPLALALAATGGFALYAPSFVLAQQAPAPAATQAAPVTFTIKRFEVMGDNPIGDAAAQAALAPFTGRPIDIEGLQKAAQALEEAFRKQGFAFHRITLPPQEATDTIKLQVLRFNIGKVQVRGNKNFDEQNIRRALTSLEVGQAPSLVQTARQMAISNENPSKRVTLSLREGDTPDTIDAVVDVKDQRPWLVAFSLNNTGDKNTSRTRLSAVLQHSNLWNLDHVGTLSYTTSPERPGDVKQWGIGYRVPVYQWNGAFNVAASKSSVDSGALGPLGNITGRGSTIGASFEYQLAPINDYKPYMMFSLDDRLFEAARLVGGPAIGLSDVRSRPFSVGYGARIEKTTWTGGYFVEYSRNLGGGSNNDDLSYALNRQFATSKWDAVRLNGDFRRAVFKDWALEMRARAQYSSHALVSGEQFGLGGMSSVRGLAERVVTGDSGLLLNTELLSPVFAQSARALVFLDAGYTSRNSPVVGQAGSDYVMSAGLGLRASLSSWGAISLDYGRTLNAVKFPPIPSGTDRVHASITVRF